MIPRQFDVGMAASAWLHQESKWLWLSVSFGKYYLNQYPKEMSFVPERFPPLRVRIRNWSKQRIRDELSKRDDLDGHRSEVLAAELIRLVPSPEEFRSLMQLENRVPMQVLTLASAAGLGPRYRDVLTDLLHSLPPEPVKGLSGRDLTTYLHILSAAKDVNLAPEVFELWRQKVADHAAIMYLAAKIESRPDAVEFIQTLKQRAGPNKSDYWLRYALRKMEPRFGPLDN
jgi:hypothetical protein